MKSNFFQKLTRGLGKTRHRLVSEIDLLVENKKGLQEEIWEKLEELLITADIGIPLTRSLLEDLRRWAKKNESEPDQLKGELKRSLIEALDGAGGDLVESPNPPTVVLVLGVNGTGKTTTIAKISRLLSTRGKSVILCAADTFRDAAIEQLGEWGKRIGLEVVAQDRGADPAAVAYDALARAKAKRTDYLFIDTAGRLHTKQNLMEELKKVKRVLGKEHPGAPHETLLVLDASIGQNNIVQARTFNEELDITGIVITKLDGTAKGGAVFPLFRELSIPIKYIGVGEETDDLERFYPEDFVEALFEEE